MSPVQAVLTLISVITLFVSVYLTKTDTKQFQAKVANAPDVLSETAPPAKTEQTAPFDISVFIYPKGTVIERSSTHLAIESEDSPNNINPWYKEQIQKYKFSAKSFASTNTNGNFLTKMAGSGADGEVKIEIKKAAPDTITLIQVDLSK